MAQDLNSLVKLMLGGRYIRAKYFRRAIDQNKQIRQRFEMSKEYVSRFDDFAQAARKAAKEGGEFSRFEFEGQTYQAGSALRTIASTKNRTGEFGRASFKQQAYTLKKLFPELAEGMELGHKNMSVLRASISSTLKLMPIDDSRRPYLKALYSLVLDIDKITEIGEKAFPELLKDLEKSISKGLNVKASYIKDVNILKGAKGSLGLEFEPKDINQYKGRLAGLVGELFREAILGNTDKLEEVFKDIDISQIKGSPSMKEDIEKQLVDLLDPKKRQRKSKSKSRIKESTKGVSVKIKKPKKGRAHKAPVGVVSRTSKRTKDIGFSQVKLYAALNSKINAVVAKNMGEPALEYRSGVFAGSVKITDVNVTRQGLPSVGYTYQLYPYQTFEPGFAQGDVDRDPRKLIDRSIREIAAQMVTGRLYTRRQ